MKRLSRRQLLRLSLSSGALLTLPCLGVETSVIRIGYFDSYSPFSFRDQNGSMKGLLVEANQHICEHAGFQVSHHGFPWARAQLMIEHGELDAFCTNPTQQRSQYALFCQEPVVRPRIGLFHLAQDRRFAEVTQRSDIHRFVLGDFIGNDWAKENLSDFRIEWTPKEEQVFRKVAAGRIDAFVSQELTAYSKLKRLGLLSKFAFTPTPFLGEFRFTFGLRRNYPEAEQAIERINHSTALLSENGYLPSLIQRYYQGLLQPASTTFTES